MDEPIDRALKVQGLKRPEYDAMSTDGKAVVSARSRRLTEIANIGVAADLFNMIAESDEKSRAYVQEVLEGKHPDFEDKMRGIIRDYLDAGVDTNIRDYYKIKYGNADITASQQAEAARDEVRQAVRQPAQPTAGKPKTILETMEEDAPPAQVSQPSAWEAEPAPALRTQPTDPDERRKSIAVILSQWEKRDPDSVMRTESDVIAYIMTVADENRDKGLTDESVCRACETMIKTAVNGVQFYREALIPPNRDELVRIAKAFIQ